MDVMGILILPRGVIKTASTSVVQFNSRGMVVLESATYV